MNGRPFSNSFFSQQMGQGSSQDNPTANEQVASGGAATMATGGGPRLYNVKFGDHQWPIVYKDSYNIGFLGLEKIHPFDAGKWGRIHKRLVGKLTCTRLCVCPCARVRACV